MSKRDKPTIASTKIQRLQEMDEDDLRKIVMLPLLSRMGLKAPILYHGVQERGKDIICFDYDKLGNRIMIGVVVKVGDLCGATSSPRGLQDVVNQAIQCFDVPYHNLYDMQSVTMDQVWIITSGKIIPGAADAVIHTLRNNHLSKLINFISGEQLVCLIDSHYPSFWNGDLETLESITSQRDKLIQFCWSLLTSLGADKHDLDGFFQHLTNNGDLPSVRVANNMIPLRVSSYAVDLIEVSGETYNHRLYAHNYGCIVKEQYRDARRALDLAIAGLDNISYCCEQVMKKNDPNEFVKSFKKEIARQAPFNGGMTEFASEAVDKIGELEESVDDIEGLIACLTKHDLRNWAFQLFDSIEMYRGEIDQFVKSSTEEQMILYWLIEDNELGWRVVPCYSPPNNKEDVIFTTTHDLIVRQPSFFKEQPRPLTVDDVLNQASSSLREYIDCKVEYRR